MNIIKKYNKIIMVILVTIILFLGIIVYTNGGISYTKYKVLSKTLYRHKQLENNGITFIGDSIVANCNLEALFNKGNIVNQGIPGNTSTDILNRLDEIIKLRLCLITVLII